MTYFAIVMLAFALSVDACVVSFSYGLSYNTERRKNMILLSLFTSVFQGLMPVIGYFLTGFVKSFIQPYSGLIIFLIFSYLGIKFIYEAYQEKQREYCIDLKCLFLIGIATSIDAFSAGISLSLMGNHILKPALLIAFVTFVNSALGFLLGGKTRYLPSKLLEILAGLLLIWLGIKAII